MTDEVELARLARRYSKEAIAALVFAIRNATDLRVKVTAALGLLDRGFGRAAQGKLPAVEYDLPLERLDEMIAGMERELGMDPGGSAPEGARTSPRERSRDAGAAGAADASSRAQEATIGAVDSPAPDGAGLR